jgi:hypothetical protein
MVVISNLQNAQAEIFSTMYSQAKLHVKTSKRGSARLTTWSLKGPITTSETIP